MNPLVRKLRHGARLTKAEEGVLMGLTGSARRVERRGDILPEGAEPRSIALVLEGWACRYKHLENGKRQIIALFLPGDLCEPFGALPPFMDHSLGTFTTVRLARMKQEALREAWQKNRRIEEALWWDLLLTDAIQRERVIGLGRRTAVERLGHLFCELQLRLAMVGLVERSSYKMPLTQEDLADILGLSVVHVNRSLQELKRLGLLSLNERQLTIRDCRGLWEASMFDPSYLRLKRAQLDEFGHIDVFDDDDEPEGG